MEIKEQAKLIKKALVLNWDCDYCKKLNFNTVKCELDKDECADILYRNLRQHFYIAIKEEFSRT